MSTARIAVITPSGDVLSPASHERRRLSKALSLSHSHQEIADSDVGVRSMDETHSVSPESQLTVVNEKVKKKKKGWEKYLGFGRSSKSKKKQKSANEPIFTPSSFSGGPYSDVNFAASTAGEADAGETATCASEPLPRTRAREVSFSKGHPPMIVYPETSAISPQTPPTPSTAPVTHMEVFDLHNTGGDGYSDVSGISRGVSERGAQSAPSGTAKKKKKGIFAKVFGGSSSKKPPEGTLTPEVLARLENENSYYSSPSFRLSPRLGSGSPGAFDIKPSSTRARLSQECREEFLHILSRIQHKYLRRLVAEQQAAHQAAINRQRTAQGAEVSSPAQLRQFASQNSREGAALSDLMAVQGGNWQDLTQILHMVDWSTISVDATSETLRVLFTVSKMRDLIERLFSEEDMAAVISELNQLEITQMTSWSRESGKLVRGCYVLEGMRGRIDSVSGIMMAAAAARTQELAMTIDRLRKRLRAAVNTAFDTAVSPVFVKRCSTSSYRNILLPSHLKSELVLQSTAFSDGEGRSSDVSTHPATSMSDEVAQFLRSKSAVQKGAVGEGFKVLSGKDDFREMEKDLDGKFGSFRLFEAWLQDALKWQWVDFVTQKTFRAGEINLQLLAREKKAYCLALIDRKLAQLWVGQAQKIRHSNLLTLPDLIEEVLTQKRPLAGPLATSPAALRTLERIQMAAEDQDARVRRLLVEGIGAEILAKKEKGKHKKDESRIELRTIQDILDLIDEATDLKFELMRDGRMFDSIAVNRQFDQMKERIADLGHQVRGLEKNTSKKEESADKKKKKLDEEYEGLVAKLAREKEKQSAASAYCDQVDALSGDVEKLKEQLEQAKKKTADLEKDREEAKTLKKKLAAEAIKAEKLAKEEAKKQEKAQKDAEAAMKEAEKEREKLEKENAKAMKEAEKEKARVIAGLLKSPQLERKKSSKSTSSHLGRPVKSAAALLGWRRKKKRTQSEHSDDARSFISDVSAPGDPTTSIYPAINSNVNIPYYEYPEPHVTTPVIAQLPEQPKYSEPGHSIPGRFSSPVNGSSSTVLGNIFLNEADDYHKGEMQAPDSPYEAVVLQIPSTLDRLHYDNIGTKPNMVDSRYSSELAGHSFENKTQIEEDGPLSFYDNEPQLNKTPMQPKMISSPSFIKSTQVTHHQVQEMTSPVLRKSNHKDPFLKAESLGTGAPILHHKADEISDSDAVQRKLSLDELVRRRRMSLQKETGIPSDPSDSMTGAKKKKGMLSTIKKAVLGSSNTKSKRRQSISSPSRERPLELNERDNSDFVRRHSLSAHGAASSVIESTAQDGTPHPSPRLDVQPYEVHRQYDRGHSFMRDDRVFMPYQAFEHENEQQLRSLSPAPDDDRLEPVAARLEERPGSNSDDDLLSEIGPTAAVSLVSTPADDLSYVGSRSDVGMAASDIGAASRHQKKKKGMLASFKRAVIGSSKKRSSHTKRDGNDLPVLKRRSAGQMGSVPLDLTFAT